jgi:hypothetical protein
MSRFTLLTRIIGVSVVGALLAGCMALPKSDRAMFQEPPLANRGTLPLNAALMTLTDARPADERGAFPDIENFPDRITLEVLMDLSEARLFTSIGQDSRGVDVILKGEIRSFQWTPRYNAVPYIPGLAFLSALGVSVAHAKGQVELSINVVDAKTDQAIGSYAKAATDTHSYWVYRFQDFTAGSDRDTDSAFRRVVIDIQSAILADADRIVAAVKR